MEALLEAGASANVGEDGRDQTLAAVCRGRPTPGIVRRLVEAGADVNGADSYGCSALHWAAHGGNVPVMESLIKLGANATTTGSERYTAMHVAANGEVVRWLAARGVSVQGEGDDNAPLQVACCFRHIDAVRALIELGADVHHRGRHAQTALHGAMECDDGKRAVEMARLLLAAGADVSAANAAGQVPLHVVKHAACVDLLLDAGADLEARDGEGRTPICVAAKSLPHKAEAVLRVADRGADLVNAGGEPGLVERVVQELRAKSSGGQAI